ncbi:MAG: SMC-Scp complex subunit ScpB, partial [Cyanobacteria bacterium]|nr:SMC-Scp complex subunit ScpB [Cyanobacteriota bacterium]
MSSGSNPQEVGPIVPLAPSHGLSLPARLEAILYLKGRPLSLAELADIAGIDRSEAELALIT